MALRRFYIDPSHLKSDVVVVQGDLFHHLRDVCRFKPGDQLELLPGDGSARLSEVLDVGGRELRLQVLKRRELSPLPKPWVTLAVSVPKLPKVDWIVEKCVELGVYEVRPFVSDYSFLRKTNEISTNRLERWQKLVLAATQQSGRGELMRVGSPCTLPDLLQQFNQSPRTAGLFPYEGESPTSLRTALRQIQSEAHDHLWVFVGSEGGFSSAEVALFAQYGMPPVTLGEQILRVETACLALASIIQYELGR